MKKLLSVLLTIALIVCAVPLGAFTASAATKYYEGDYTYTVSDGKATLIDVSTSVRGNITIPSTLGGYPVTKIGGDAFDFCDDITSIKLPYSIENIEYFAFDFCESLSEITVDEGNQYFCAEEGVLFNKNKTELVRYPSAKAGTSYNIPNSVQKIATSSFARCENLTNISIGNEVTNVSNWAFQNCANLTSVTIGEGVTRLGEGAFAYCYELSSIVLPGSITTIEVYVFLYCDNLTIYGQEGSYVEQYALARNIPFEQAYYKTWENMSVETTGVYEAVLAYDSNIDENKTGNSEGSLIDVFDKNGKRIKYNEIKDGYPLLACENYTIKLRVDLEFIGCIFAKKADTIFPDTSGGEWYNDPVTYVVGRGLMSGYGSNGYFGTADGIQRQDFMVMLARLDGVDLTEYVNKTSPFKDVPNSADCYYKAAVIWGYENEIVKGYSDGSGRFGVGDKITREQIVTFMYRYAMYKGLDVSYSDSTKQNVSTTYTDFNYVTDYAVEPVLWAIENGVIKGKTPTTIVPYGNTLRCEIAQIMYNIFLNDIF